MQTPLGSLENGPCLCRNGRTDAKGREAFEYEDPGPAIEAADPVHAHNGIAEEAIK
jgi:hypothetical protein